MEIQAFFAPRTFRVTYVAFAPASRDAVVIDRALDHEIPASCTSTAAQLPVER